MATKFLVSTPGFEDPAGYKVLDGGGPWDNPDGKRRALDARAEWNPPELGIAAGDLPVGTPGNDTLIKFLTFLGARVVWRVIGHNLPGMPSGSLTLLADKILAFLSYDAAEPNNTDTRCKSWGNADWTKSNLRQWLNSAAGPGEWYKAQHAYDAPPSVDNVYLGTNPYESSSGFLSESTQAESNLILISERHCGIYGSNGRTCNDKIFLLTTNELNNKSIYPSNGTVIPYFATNKSKVATSTPECIDHYGYENGPSQATNVGYWTSTNDDIQTERVYSVDYEGSIASNFAYIFIGVRPACNIPDTVMLTAKPDADGCYNLIL